MGKKVTLPVDEDANHLTPHDWQILAIIMLGNCVWFVVALVIAGVVRLF